MNRSCPVGYEKGHQFTNLVRSSWPADRNSSKRIHQALARSAFVEAVFLGQPGDQGLGGGGFNKTGRDCVHSNAFRPDLLREAFAVRRQCRLGGCIGERRFEQRQAPLDGGDVDDNARSLLQHSGQQSAVETDGGEQVGVDCMLPILVAESEHAAARRRRSADTVDEDVHAAETVQNSPTTFSTPSGVATSAWTNNSTF